MHLELACMAVTCVTWSKNFPKKEHGAKKLSA